MLKDTILINGVKLKNRLVMPPMATAKSSPDGSVTQALCDYYYDRAKGGCIGTIITEHSYYMQQGKASAGQISFTDDSKVDGLKKLVDAIHSGGSAAIAQLNHAGSATTSEVTGEELVSASAVMNPGTKPGVGSELPRELTKSEIISIQESFTSAAMRAKAAGYDGVEIHAAHGYLLNQFYSPLTNKRDDEYGPQSIENRTRFTLEMYGMVRKALGNDFLIFVRLGGCDYMPHGSTIEDAVGAAKLFEQAGVDVIDLSGGMCRYMRPDKKEPGYFSDMSSAVKAAVKTPVILTGGITALDVAESLLSAGAADMIGVGRAMMKDADWAARNLAG